MRQRNAVLICYCAKITKEQNLKKKYVKDYIPGKKGELEYRGKYYKSDLSEKERKKESLIQIIYGISCLFFILIALCIPCNGNQTVYVVIPVEITLVCLTYYVLGSLALRKAGGRLEQKDYDKAYQNPIQALTIAIFFYVFAVSGQVIGILTKVSKRSSGDIYFCMILFLVLVISCVMWNHQRKIMHYVTEENKCHKKTMI